MSKQPNIGQASDIIGPIPDLIGPIHADLSARVQRYCSQTTHCALHRNSATKCERPQHAGLKAAFAVYHRGVFQSDEQAWTFYGSTRQRFYEWKPAIQALLIEESSNTINTLDCITTHATARDRLSATFM